MQRVITDLEQAVDAILERVGRRIVLGLPLGVGKPNHLVNAIVRRAVDDESIDLTISSGLSLDVPRAGEDFEGRLLGPVYDRLYEGYPGLDYVRAAREDDLPPNIEVAEFFLRPGAQMNESSAQQGHLGSNYSHAVRDGVARGVNVFAQAVTPAPYNLSTNADLTLDLLAEAKRVGREVFMVAQTDGRMPRLAGEAERTEGLFDLVLDDRSLDFDLFAVPDEPISLLDWAIGLHAASTVRDGGTLQLGIGALADAVSRALVLRHRDDGMFRRALASLVARDSGRGLGGVDRFEIGLYAATEMFSEGFLELFEAGVLRRAVDGRVDDPHPAVLHGGFVLGSSRFYERLRGLSGQARSMLRTAPISFINEAYVDYVAKASQRAHARFINSGLKATALGAVCSDAVADQRVISGVGGQYNFVAMAHAIPNARSVLLIRSTRTSSEGVESNIVWNYGHVTIPRHLRDVVISEYGVADLRGRTDAEAVAAMIDITDSRFQDDLRRAAVDAGKLPGTYEIPEARRHNYPETVEARLDGHSDALPLFPFGTELDDVELDIARALRTLDEELDLQTVGSRLDAVGRALRIPAGVRQYLERMDLDAPASLKERGMRTALAYGIALTRD